MSKTRRFRPSPAMIVACLALFVALGSGAYAVNAKLKKNSVKTKTIKNGAVTTPKLSAKAVAPDAAKLGGIDPAGYQGFCKPGAIKGSLVIVTSAAMSSNYTPVGGFNCSSTAADAVQIKRVAASDYNVKFTGNDSGSAVVSPINNAGIPVFAVKIADGEFDLHITDGGGFALVAF